MRFISNEEVASVMSMPLAIEAIEQAFRVMGEGGVAQQRRIRSEQAGSKISTMAAVMPGLGVSGAKVYSTVDGQFRFAVLLFSSSTGELLACVQADELTRYRTAAASVVAARRLADPASRVLGMFGTGVQAWAHVQAMVSVFAIEQVRVFGVSGTQAFAARIGDELGVAAEVADARHAAAADIVVTATRARTPILEGTWLRPGSFVAAIGSSQPTHREIDDRVLARAACVCVEWIEQARIEAGDLLLAPPELALFDNAVELGPLVTGAVPYARQAADITVYKGVGVALEDVALAARVLIMSR